MSRSYRVRDLVVTPAAVLAPMEGVTDLGFRRLIRAIGGCGMTFTEFVPARGLVEDHARVRELVQFDPDERPIGIQVYGRDPALLAEAARVAEGLGADIVDLNMGCPSKKVCAHSGGSALMREPELAREIVAAIRAAVTVPFTVKMRAGWDPAHRNAPDIAWMCQEEGAEAVTVHWRTRADLYGGERELDTIAQVKARLSVPVIANGDITDATTALQTLAATGADGVMVGRGAIRNPWVFREIEAAFAGAPASAVTPAERERVLIAYFDAVRARFATEHGALGRMKKIAKYFTEGVPHGAEHLRPALLRSDSVDEAYDRTLVFFERLRRYEAGDVEAFAAAP